MKHVGMGYSQEAKQESLEQENAELKAKVAELEKELSALKAQPQTAKTK